MQSAAHEREKAEFDTRGEALGHFFSRAGDAPRLVAYEEEVGCPLLNALSVLEWTTALGVLRSDDILHAARLSGGNRRRDGRA